MFRRQRQPAAPERAGFLTRLRSIELVSTRLVESLLAGGYRSVFRGQGIEFDEVREYAPGDDMRLIDWNVTSRMGSPYTKVFREERELTLFLLADVSASLYAGSGAVGKDQVALLVFAILALAAVANNDRVGAAFFSDRIEQWASPAKGRKHVTRLLNDFAGYRARGRGSEMTAALRAANESLKRRGICILLSDFKTDGFWDELAQLARKHDVIAVRITDPADFAFPEAGLIDLVDAESDRSILSAGSTSRFSDRYAACAADWHSRWLEGCRRRGVETLEISTSEEPGEKLFRFFEHRRRRRGR